MTSQTRTVRIAPERLQIWLDGFEARHPGGRWTFADGRPAVRAPDGAEAVVVVPFGLPPDAELPAALIADAARPRTVGALLVRKGGFAVGVFDGRELLASKVGSGYVQGRTKAGGWSQQRFARRRANQASKAYAEAADTAAAVLLPRQPDLEAVATGGDRVAVREVLSDPRLAPLGPLVMERTHPVPEPRLRVLHDFPGQFLALEILLNGLA